MKQSDFNNFHSTAFEWQVVFSFQKIVSEVLGLRLSHIEHSEQQTVMQTEIFYALAATTVTGTHCPAASQMLTGASKSAIHDKLFYLFIYLFIYSFSIKLHDSTTQKTVVSTKNTTEKCIWSIMSPFCYYFW